MSAKSIVSWTELAKSMAHPQERVAITSEWSPKIESACVATHWRICYSFICQQATDRVPAYAPVCEDGPHFLLIGWQVVVQSNHVVLWLLCHVSAPFKAR